MKRISIIVVATLLVLSSIIGTSYYLGLQTGEDKGFTKAFDDTYNKFLETSDIKRVDFSGATLDLDSRRLVQLLVESIEVEDDSLEAKFSNVLYDVHIELLNEYLEEVDVSDSLIHAFMATYDSIHVALSTEYFDRFTLGISKSMGTPDRFILENQSSIIADEFSTTVAHGLCDVILTVASFLTMKERILFRTVANEVIFAGFCSQVLEGIIPILKQSFHGAGVYNDMHKLEMIFGEHKRQSIAELATIEDVIPSVAVEKLQLGRKWYQSNARIKVSGNSRIKAGVDLFDHFAYEVDPVSKTLRVYVEKPKILSIEVNTVTNEVRDGVFNNVVGSTLDQARQDIEIESRKIAIENGILEDSKDNFENIFESIFMPVLRLKGIEKIDYEYRSKAYFEEKLKG